MHATLEAEPTLFGEWEEDTDIDIQDFPALTDKHHVCNCGTCTRLLLARRHLGERTPAYAVTDDDVLPPVAFGQRVVRVAGGVHRVPECLDCYRVRRGRYAAAVGRLRAGLEG